MCFALEEEQRLTPPLGRVAYDREATIKLIYKFWEATPS